LDAARRILFLRQILKNDVADRPLGARRQHPQVLWERFHVPVILRGVKLERFPAQLARLPILIKGMLEQILFGNRGINFV